MRRDIAALLQRARRAQHCSLPPPLRACSSAAEPSERVVHSLADTSGDSVTELNLSGSGGAPHADLVCVNIMCEHVGGVCICRLSRVLERPSLAGLRTLRLAGNGCARERGAHAVFLARSSRASPGATGSRCCRRACGSCASCACLICETTAWPPYRRRVWRSCSWTSWTQRGTRYTRQQETAPQHDSLTTHAHRAHGLLVCAASIKRRSLRSASGRSGLAKWLVAPAW